MSRTLQFSLLIISIAVLATVILNVVKNKMNIKYAMVWILWGIIIVVFAMFPNIIFSITKLIGVEMPVNGVFLFMIFLLYCLSFYVYLIISKHNEELISLNYEISILKQKVKELEGKNK